jgi:glycine betaine/proline transport system substrate-binding protein
MNRSITTFALALVLTLGGTALADAVDRPGEGITVRPAIAGWDSAIPPQAVAGILLEELGYDVATPVMLDNPIFYVAIMQGDVDFWTDGSFPLHDTHLPPGFDDHASIVGMISEASVIQGYSVSAWAAEAYGITSLEDFKRPEVKAAFDRTGDGRAELVACPAGWGCEAVIEHHLDAYDLREHINDQKANYNAAFADALAAHRAGEPILFYSWVPNFTNYVLEPGEDVVWINVPEIVPNAEQVGFEDRMVLEGVPGAVSDPLLAGFVADDHRSVANDAFLDANPPAARFLELFAMPVADIGLMTLRIEQGESSAQAVHAMALEWIEANRDTVDGWLAEARAAAE